MRLGHYLSALIPRSLRGDSVRAIPIHRPLAAGCLALTLLGAARSGDARVIPGVPVAQRPPHAVRGDAPGWVRRTSAVGSAPATRLQARTDNAHQYNRATSAPGWQGFTYGGVSAQGGSGRTSTGIPGYSLAYPSRWIARLWPDTLAEYGRLDLWSPAGSAIDITLIPLRPHGPALADLIANDGAYLSGATRDSIALPLGAATRLSGTPNPGGAGRSSQVLYLRRGAVVYRLSSSWRTASPERGALAQVASTLRALAGGLFRTTAPPPPPAPQPGGETCCHCPAWGPGWGVALTSLDGVPVYWNAGDGDNGCVGTYGILYQCVELAQRYFALRWGYPDMWGGVGAASDMRANHPGDIEFIPNGGSPGPREGDALIFYGGAFGHVAVVRSVDLADGRLDVVEENWSSTGTAALRLYADNTVGIRDSPYGSYTVAGWLHSPKNG